MHHHNIELWQHQHAFNSEKRGIEKRTLIVLIITVVMMIAEVLAGWLFNSMALLADGWHMGTHAFALGISLFAYILARKYSADQKFTFGTWKIEILGAYTSSIILGIVGIIMIFSSLERIIKPLNILYNQALFVAVIGLIVNIICALILNIHDHSGQTHKAEAEHGHKHAHVRLQHPHDDLNLRSAYLHILADALTSILAIIALFGAKYYNYNYLDPLMGIVGALLILRWAYFLLRDTAGILLQREINSRLSRKIQLQTESDNDTKISDLHLWQVAQNRYACIISVVTGKKCTIEDYKERLKSIHELAHLTIEINECGKNQHPE